MRTTQSKRNAANSKGKRKSMIICTQIGAIFEEDQLELNIGDTITFYHSQYYAGYFKMESGDKMEHPSFIKKYICHKPTQFYREWKQMIVFCDDVGLKSIASSAVYSCVIQS
eukprot:188690_1